MTTISKAPLRGVFASFATMRILRNLLVGSVALLFAMTATAASLVWTFDNALFQNDGGVVGGEASGSFTFDTVTATYSDIDISTSTSTGSLNQYDAVLSGSVASSTQLAVVSSGSQGVPIFTFLWNTPLSDADLERTFVGADVGGSDAFGLECLSTSVTPDCAGTSRSIATGGRLTASAVGLAFVADGLFYTTSGNNKVEVTGRAAGNAATVINIPGSVSNGGITYSVTSIGARAFEDNLLTSVIIANVGAMACDYWGIEDNPGHITLYNNCMTAFSYIYYIEFVFKFSGLGPKQYFSDAWCQFDFFLVTTSLLDQFAAELLAQVLPLPPMLLRVLRVFRVLRILRLLKGAKGVRDLIMTMVLAA